MFDKILRGIIAGLVATAVLSLLMLSKKLIPQLDTVMVLDGIAHGVFKNLSLPVPLAGWMWHFLIGTIWWGGWFGIIEPIIPGRNIWLRGVYFGLALGLLVTWAILPLAGAGAYDMRFSPLQPVVTVVEHIAYGLVLGLVFGRLSASNRAVTEG